MSCFWSILLFTASTAIVILGDPVLQIPQYRTTPPNEAKYQKVQYQPNFYRVTQVEPNEHQTVGIINLYPSSDVAYQTWSTSTFVNQTIYNMTTDYMTTLNTTIEYSTILSSATPFPLQPTFVDPVEYMHETQYWYNGNSSSPINRTEIVDNGLPLF